MIIIVVIVYIHVYSYSTVVTCALVLITHMCRVGFSALQLLRAIDKPLDVLVISGPYRSGKSYFLSKLLGRPRTFLASW